MTEILFVKTSSLGDVIHHMPAVTESRAHFPQARIAWLVEEAYAPLVALHPGVHRVIGVAWRRWRRQLLHAKAWREFGEWRRQLGADRFDHIVDTQGLLRSAVMSRFARGRRHGYDRDSVRERPAAMFYDVRHRVSRAEHAVARNRMLTGLALGYRPEGAPDYGLDRSRLREAGEPYAVLLHGTAQRDKEWPVENWIALGRGLGHSLGRGLLVPWGNETERLRAVQIVEAVPHARLAERRPIEGMARLIAGADCVVGGDTGLVHLAAALGVPLVAIFCGSDPALTRPVGAGPIETVGAKGIVPPVEDVRDALDKIFTLTRARAAPPP